MSEEGYVFWQRGGLWFSLCQFRDNILFASNQPPGRDIGIVQMVADTLSEIWNLEDLCPCVDAGATRCDGACLAHTARALGISMAVGGGVGIGSAHPSALADSWSLRYGFSDHPSMAAPKYLAYIFTSGLTAPLPWQYSCSAQILFALAWAQVALSSDYDRMTVMRAMHKSVCRVYCASPWNVEGTVRAVYALAHHQPCPEA